MGQPALKNSVVSSRDRENPRIDYELISSLLIKIFSKIFGYSTASTDDAAIIIGGVDVFNTIAEFRNNQWRELGKLTEGRSSHGSITVEQETMIIGGTTPYSS